MIMALKTMISEKQLAWGAGLAQLVHWLPWIIIAIGILLRLVFYLANRALFIDEAAVAINIVNKSYSEFFQPLDYFGTLIQGAPVGFLIVEKFAVEALSKSEFALRLFPLLSGIASLFLFASLAKRLLRPNAILIALVIFTVSYPLMLYSTEVKPYSSDVAIALLLVLFAEYVRRRGFPLVWLIAYGITGAVSVWLSFPAVFVLAGVGTTLGVSCVLNRNWIKSAQLSIVFLVWLLSFGISFFASPAGSLANNEGLFIFYAQYAMKFAPLPPLSLSELQWYLNTFFEIFDNPVGISLGGIAGLAFLMGCASFYTANRFRFFLLISPILFTLLASGLGKYPFTDRFILFLVPFLLLLVAEGVGFTIKRTKSNLPILGVTLAVILLGHPILTAGYHVVNSRTREEIKPIMNYLKTHKEPGDAVYLYYSAEPAFRYYADEFLLDTSDVVVGVSSRADTSKYLDDLDKLRGNQRTWLVFSHVADSWEGIHEENFFLIYLNRIGTKLDSSKARGASIYLFDLSEH